MITPVHENPTRKTSTVSFTPTSPPNHLTPPSSPPHHSGNKALAYVHTNVLNSISALGMLYDSKEDKEKLEGLIEHVQAELAGLGGGEMGHTGARARLGHIQSVGLGSGPSPPTRGFHHRQR